MMRDRYGAFRARRLGPRRPRRPQADRRRLRPPARGPAACTAPTCAGSTIRGGADGCRAAAAGALRQGRAMSEPVFLLSLPAVGLDAAPAADRRPPAGRDHVRAVDPAAAALHAAAPGRVRGVRPPRRPSGRSRTSAHSCAAAATSTCSSCASSRSRSTTGGRRRRALLPRQDPALPPGRPRDHGAVPRRASSSSCGGSRWRSRRR